MSHVLNINSSKLNFLTTRTLLWCTTYRWSDVEQKEKTKSTKEKEILSYQVVRDMIKSVINQTDWHQIKELS